MGRPVYKDQLMVVVGSRASPEKPMKTVVKSGTFEIVLDKVGGEAPSPIEYLLASLAGCVNIVGEIVAKEMGVRIEDLRVEVTGVFNASKLMTGVGDRAGYREISVSVHVKSDAQEAVLREWLERVRERCPVSDNLEAPTPVKMNVEKM